MVIIIFVKQDFLIKVIIFFLINNLNMVVFKYNACTGIMFK